MVSLEYKTFIACTATISRTIAPLADDISAALLEKGIISHNVEEKIRWEDTGEGKATQLVSAVGARISDYSEAYHDFLEVLQLDSYYPDTAEAVELLAATYESEWAPIRKSCMWEFSFQCLDIKG